MMTRLKTELKKLFKEADNEVCRSFFRENFPKVIARIDWYEDEVVEFYHQLDGAEITYKKEDHCGGEGQGEEYWTVYSFTKNGETVYIKFDGYYQSYDGSTYDDWSFVTPVQKTITVYE